MRAPRVGLALLGILAAVVILLRRRSEVVEIRFYDGSSVQLTGGAEAEDLLDDAYAILELAS